LWESRSSPTLIKGFSQKLNPFLFITAQHGKIASIRSQ
jgi:hypothetical protein